MAPLGSRLDCSPAEALHPPQGEPSLGAHRASQKWYVASWNVRTLLDVEGSIETARGFGDGSVVDERKVDQVLSELDRYGVVVAGLQETKCFGVSISFPLPWGWSLAIPLPLLYNLCFDFQATTTPQ